MAIWGSLPGAIGDFAFQAANGLISGVEAMLNLVPADSTKVVPQSIRTLSPLRHRKSNPTFYP